MEMQSQRPQTQATNAMPSHVVSPTSPALQRLMDEVRNKMNFVGGSYDRVHNRHNRGQ